MTIVPKLTLSALALTLLAGRAHALAIIGGGACAPTIDQHYTWSYDTPTVGSGNAQFGVGVGAGVAATGDCNKIMADASVAIRARVMAISGNALEAHLTATTTKEHRHALSVGLYAFSYQLTTPIEIASSTAPLADRWMDGWTLPTNGLTNTWQGSKSVSIPGHGSPTVGYAVRTSMVMDLCGIASYDVAPTSLYAGFWGQANVMASVSLSGSGSFEDGKLRLGVEGTASFTAFKGMAQAYADFDQATLVNEQLPSTNSLVSTPTLPAFDWHHPFENNAWRIRALAEYKIDDAIHGLLKASVTGTYDSNPSDTVAGVDILPITFTIYEVTSGLPSSAFAAKSWKVDKTFWKPFT